MAELRDSVSDDVLKGRMFSWFTRMRQPEQLYFRTLYVLFLAIDDEVPTSCPAICQNSFSDIYKRVNAEILEGRGEIKTVKPGLISGEFRMIDTLNDGAHVGFCAMQMVVSFGRYPEYGPKLDEYLKHIDSYCTKINYMKNMF